MHVIDQAIFDNTLTPALLEAEAKKPLPPEGASYWGDAMRTLFVRSDAVYSAAFPSDRVTLESLPARAAKLAAAQMGVLHTFILGARAA
jgi:hypothetical protein